MSPTHATKPPMLAQHLGMLRAAERTLADAYEMVADRHERDADIHDMCRQLAAWPARHEDVIDGFSVQLGERGDDEPARIRRALFRTLPIGGVGKLRDLQDLAVLAGHVKLAWTALLSAAGALHDRGMEQACAEALSDTERQLSWLQTEIKHTAHQALTVAPDRLSTLKASLPKTARGAVWMARPLAKVMLGTALIGGAAVLLRRLADPMTSPQFRSNEGGYP
jgi:hypothetical protein